MTELTKGKKKVAFIVSSLNLGGAQRAISNITINLPDDWDIRLVLNTDKDIAYPYKGEIVSLGIDGGGDRVGLVYQGKAFIKRFRYLKKMKQEEEFDAVISFLDSANIVNLSTGKSGKNIISVRNCLYENKSWKYRYIVGPLVKRTYNKADYIVAVADGTRQDLVDNYSIDYKKVVTICNGYNVDNIFAVSKRKASVEMSSDDINIVTAGRLAKQKGQWHLIRAMRRVVDKYPNAKLFIMGEGDLRDYLTNLAKGLDLEDNIILTGFVNDVYEIMGKADMFVLPSLHEGMSNVLIEAMACGLPCVSTDHKSGAREIMKENADISYQCKDVEYADYGILVPVMSEKMNSADEAYEREEVILSDVIIKMIEDKDQRLKYSKASVERAKYFSIENVISKWIDII